MKVIDRIFQVLFVLAVQASVFVCVLEVVGRVFDPWGISYYPEMARYLDTLIREEPIGYRNQPGLKGRFFGTSVQINAHGLRDKEISTHTDRDIFRILFLGDSVPFGVGVEQKDTLPSQLEHIANAHGQYRVKYEVLNMGVPSYNTEQELIQLKTVGMALDPDLVLLLFNTNDIEPKMWVFEKRAGWIKDMIQRSYAGSLLFILYRELNTRFQPHFETVLEEAFAGYLANQERWMKLRSAMAEMNSLLRARDIPLVVFLNHENRALVNLLSTEARQEGFPLVPLQPWQDPRWAGADRGKFVNSFVDGHPNAKGNSILATLVHESLVESKLLLGAK